MLKRNYVKELGEIKLLDFANHPIEATQEINNVVKEQTNGKITELLPVLPANTLVVLLSTIYFKSTWASDGPIFEPRVGTLY